MKYFKPNKIWTGVLYGFFFNDMVKVDHNGT